MNSTWLLFGCLFKYCYCKGVCLIFKFQFEKTHCHQQQLRSLHQASWSSQTLLFFLFILIPAGIVFQITESIRKILHSTVCIPRKSFFGCRRELGNCWIHCWCGQYPSEETQIIYRSILASAAASGLTWAIRSVYITACFSHTQK